VRILRRYILGEVLSHALIGMALFTFVVFMRDLGRIMELVVRNSAPALSVAEIFLFTLPAALTVTIPMGALVGILLGLSRLAADSEVTAMRASGLGTWTFVRIVAVFAVAAWLLASVNNLWLAPKAAAGLVDLQGRLKASQASYEVQPRVFYEDFKNYVLYVQDTTAAGGVAVWKGIFLADVSTPGAPTITMARAGIVQQQSATELRLHLEDGSKHEVQAKTPEQYAISQFQSSDIPIILPSATQAPRETVSTGELSTAELWRLGNNSPPGQARWYLIEFHRRLGYPAACLVLALVGIPLGLSAKKGGKSSGFVITIVLVFLYYFASLAGVALARQGKVGPAAGVWAANVLFLIAGIVLLWRSERRPLELSWLHGLSPAALKARFWKRLELARGPGGALDRAMHRTRLFSTKFPLILDDYVLREFLVYASMVLASFLMLTLVFTFFEILKDILRNGVGIGTVSEYLLMVLPSMLYLMTPMSVLIAVLVTFGLMSRSNEITAMKATGISVYRAVVPVLVMAAVIATGLFFFDQIYLPRFNKRQETLFNRIKGRPPQTYLRPDRKVIVGAHHEFYYYEFYDADRNTFGNITVLEFDPQAFQITRRIHASDAEWDPRLQRWVFKRGWDRQFSGSAIRAYQPFEVATFSELNEPPQYFKKEVKQSSEMNYAELEKYIRDLEQSGFDVVRLRVQLQKKLAFPLITLVMAVLAIPFSLSAGRRGALTGVAVAIGLAVVYWVTAGLFEALGNVSYLPPALAAWAPDLLFGLGGGYLIFKVPT
jgi:LPS export ABC transporter permease LptF/LPS export ABC transporter permease LptG